MKHQEEITKNQEISIRRIERQIAQLVKHFVEMGEKRLNTLSRATEDKPTNNEDAAKKEGWKRIIEESKKTLDKESTSQEKHNKEFLQGETEDRIKEKQKIPTGRFSLGDRVMINSQTMKVSPQLFDHYIVTKILPQEFIEVIKEETGRKFTVKKDKPRHCDFQSS